MQEPEVTSLMWLRDIKRLGIPKLMNIESITRSNVVFHVSPTLSSEAKRRRLLLGVLIDKYEDTEQPSGRELLKRSSNTNPNNPFAHYKS